MTETMDANLADAGVLGDRGWIHAHDATGDFPTEFVAELARKAIGDTIHLTGEHIDEIAPSVELEPAAAGPNVIDEDEDNNGVLLYVEAVDGTLTDDGGSFTVRATHHPRDVYGPSGTPLRDAINLLESNDVDPNDIVAARADLLQDTGVDYGDHLEQIRRGNEYWVKTYCGGVDAAKQSLTTVGRNTWFPGSCCHGDEYVAIAARDLIGTVAGWTWDAYERVARPYAQATGRKLHPEDPDWQ